MLPSTPRSNALGGAPYKTSNAESLQHSKYSMHGELFYRPTTNVSLKDQFYLIHTGSCIRSPPGLQRLILEKSVVETEVGLNSLAPAGFVIEVNVCALLVLVSCHLRLLVTLFRSSHGRRVGASKQTRDRKNIPVECITVDARPVECMTYGTVNTQGRINTRQRSNEDTFIRNDNGSGWLPTK